MFINQNPGDLTDYRLLDSLILPNVTINATIKKGEDGIPVFVLDVDDHETVSHLLTFTLEATEWFVRTICVGEEVVYIRSCGGLTRISRPGLDADRAIHGPSTKVDIPYHASIPFTRMIFEAAQFLRFLNFKAGLIEKDDDNYTFKYDYKDVEMTIEYRFGKIN